MKQPFRSEHDNDKLSLQERIEKLEEAIRNVEPRFQHAKMVYKKLDYEYSRLLCSLQDLKRLVFEKEKGITQCKPAGEPRGQNNYKPKPLSFDDLVAKTKGMKSEEIAALIEQLKGGDEDAERY